MKVRLVVVVAVLLVVAASTNAQAPPPGSTKDSSSSGKNSDQKPEYPKEIGGENLDEWIKKLKSSDASARDAAIKVIPLFGEPATKAFKDIVPLINDPDNTVKATAMLTLSSLPIEDSKLRDELIRRLRDHISFTGGIMRLHACLCVAQIGVDAVSCIPALTTALKDMTSYETRKAAATALGMLGRADGINGPNLQALTALLNQITDPSLAVRVEVVQSLIILGRPQDERIATQEATILLARLARETDKTLSIWVRVCLMWMDAKHMTDENVGHISKLLKDPKLRMHAAEALSFLGKFAKSRMFEIMEGLKSDKPEDLPFVAMCIRALWAMGSEARVAVPEIEKFLAHKDPIIKEYAKQAIEGITGKKMPTTP